MVLTRLLRLSDQVVGCITSTDKVKSWTSLCLVGEEFNLRDLKGRIIAWGAFFYTDTVVITLPRPILDLMRKQSHRKSSYKKSKKRLAESGPHPSSQGRNCLKDNMKREPVFLVVDNITDDSASRMEASAYLEVGFHPHSKIMITSRSEDIVQALFRDSSSTFCKAMPDLTEEEAGFIFQQRALDALTDEEKRVFKLCLCQCCFSSDGGPIRVQQYHPLPLRALGELSLN